MLASAFVGLTFCLTLAASCQSEGVGSVAFSAGLSSRQRQVLETGVIVPYNRIYMNQGLGYSNSTGVFTAPKGGLYVFHIHAETVQNQGLWLRLYHNSEWLVTAHAATSAAYAHAANSIVLKLKKNDQVYVKTTGQSHLQCQTDAVYATFTGYLIGSILDYFSTELTVE
jgi:hypothetical protein